MKDLSKVLHAAGGQGRSFILRVICCDISCEAEIDAKASISPRSILGGQLIRWLASQYASLLFKVLNLPTQYMHFIGHAG
jgi:hypothetical protein